MVASARDPAVSVRECACFLLGQLSECCAAEILEYHKDLLPVIFSLLEDSSLSVQATSCHVLETLCEHLTKEVRQTQLPSPPPPPTSSLMHLPSLCDCHRP